MKAFLARIERRFIKATLAKSEPEIARQIRCALISIDGGALMIIQDARNNLAFVYWVPPT